MKFTVSDVIIWAGIILGILDWLSDMVYNTNVEFNSPNMKIACVTFIALQPIWYMFMFIVHVGSHESLDRDEKKSKMHLAIPFAVLHWFKLMGGSENYNRHITDKFKKDHQLFFNLENSYRMQIVFETALQTVP